ncbi:Cell wall protein [Melia azedarach]|uniref:Cell wall protein n=1 Tax=Melia azedarach TaxID=155640 RepID=A0ACC1Z353_MELAZ|nr:Cell wall protein [Melia azedarach]
MAYKTVSSLLAQIFILSVLLAQALAGRGDPKTAKNADVKQPEWLLKSDHSLLIPGIGRVMLPPGLGTPYNPYTGGGSTGGTGATGGYLPGGDDTFVPNPGFEAPKPGRGVEGVPPNAHP